MLKRLVHQALCALGWHDWEEVPGEWEEDFPGCKSYTNAKCRRCPARADITWMSEEEARAILKESFPDLYGSQRD